MSSHSLESLLLIVGYLSLAAGLLVAIRTPAGGYHLSIYAAMPRLFWIGAAAAIVVAVAVVMRTPDDPRLSGLGIGLLTLAVVSITALPLLRSFYFYGAGDSLSHLGWAREMAAGVIRPVEIIYPGVHLLSIEFAQVAGIPLRRAAQLLVLVTFPLSFVASFTACAYYVVGTRRAAAVAAAVAAMFVPINNVSVHPMMHPSSQAILLFPTLLFCLLFFLDDRDDGFALSSATGLLLAVVSLGYLFVHPQETMTYLSMLIGIGALQLVYRRYRSDSRLAAFRPVYAHAVVVGVAFLVWVYVHDRARSRATTVIEGLLIQDPSVLEETGSRSASLVQLGGSISELYLKLFGVTTLLMILAGALIAVLWLGWYRPGRRRDAFIRALSVGLVLPTAGFFAVFVAQQGDHYFRFHGFIMVTVSLLAVLAITAGAERLERWSDGARDAVTRTQVRTALAAALVVLLALQLVVVHPSPYIYQPNDRVTETVVDGYETTLRYQEAETPLTGVRAGSTRYLDAIYGTDTMARRTVPGADSYVPGPIFNANVTSYYEEDRYLIVTTRERKTEVDLYDGLRYRRSGFEALRTEPGAMRILDNGGYTLYRLRGTETEVGPATGAGTGTATGVEPGTTNASAGPGTATANGTATGTEPGPGTATPTGTGVANVTEPGTGTATPTGPGTGIANVTEFGTGTATANGTVNGTEPGTGNASGTGTANASGTGTANATAG